ncbi:MAG: hypothetical protein J6K75_02615 [Erysipelotrichaceae bacterium]|nr:hypothetical protein [Erysipelotrichaceae bacterium]MBQ7889578.1 hypothetical protein [Erysipelotrichaceae bacterium]
MNSAVTLFLVCVILIVLPMMSSAARRKRYEVSMKQYLDKRMLHEKKIQINTKKK